MCDTLLNDVKTVQNRLSFKTYERKIMIEKKSEETKINFHKIPLFFLLTFVMNCGYPITYHHLHKYLRRSQ